MPQLFPRRFEAICHQLQEELPEMDKALRNTPWVFGYGPVSHSL